MIFRTNNSSLFVLNLSPHLHLVRYCFSYQIASAVDMVLVIKSARQARFSFRRTFTYGVLRAG